MWSRLLQNFLTTPDKPSQHQKKPQTESKLNQNKTLPVHINKSYSNPETHDQKEVKQLKLSHKFSETTKNFFETQPQIQQEDFFADIGFYCDGDQSTMTLHNDKRIKVQQAANIKLFCSIVRIIPVFNDIPILKVREFPFGSGVIINPRVIFTVAHNIWEKTLKKTPDYIFVEPETESSQKKLIRVAKFLIHKNYLYNPNPQQKEEFDLAILILEQNDIIKPHMVMRMRQKYNLNIDKNKEIIIAGYPQSEIHEINTGIQLIKEALKIIENNPNKKPTEIVKYQVSLAKGYLYRNQFTMSLKFLNNNLQILKNSQGGQNSFECAEIHNIIGSIFQNAKYHKKNYTQAKQHFIKCLQIEQLHRGKNNLFCAPILSNIGNLCLLMDQIEQAKEYLKQSVYLYKKSEDVKNKKGQALALFYLGCLYEKQNNKVEAVKLVKESYELLMVTGGKDTKWALDAKALYERCTDKKL